MCLASCKRCPSINKVLIEDSVINVSYYFVYKVTYYNIILHKFS